MRFRVLLVVAVLAVFVAGCGGQETPVEQAEEEAGVEEVSPKEQPKEQAQGQSAFVGEHENLKPGDTAEWNAGMKITISDVYIAPNESRRKAEERQAYEEAKAKERGGQPKASGGKALEGPERLIAFSWTIVNNGQTPLNFRGALPCQGLDKNGLQLPRAEGSTAEEIANPKAAEVNKILEQPLEQGQTRSGLGSIPVPDSGAAEFVCVHPPQQGGEPNIAQIPEQGRATWILDPAELEFRE